MPSPYIGILGTIPLCTIPLCTCVDLIVFSALPIFQLILNGDRKPEPTKNRKPTKIKSNNNKKKNVSKLDFDDLSKDSLFIDGDEQSSFSKVLTTTQSKKKRDKSEKSLTVDQLNTRDQYYKHIFCCNWWPQESHTARIPITATSSVTRYFKQKFSHI